MIRVEEIFENEILGFEIKERLNKENHSRLYILAKNSLKFIEENNNERNINLFSQMLDTYPKDLRLGIMKEIRKEYKDTIYNDILDNDEFLNTFFNIFK